MLLVCRHGRTATNAEGRLLGRADPGLDELGRQQAAALAAVVPPGARVVASPLRRTVETAAAFGRPVSTDERWIELDYGEYEGMRLADIPAALWARWRSDLTFTPPGGESLAALGERVRAACDDLLVEATEGDVVVVTHVSPLKAAVGWALGSGDGLAWRLRVDPGTVSRIGVGPTGPVLVTFNETPPLPTT